VAKEIDFGHLIIKDKSEYLEAPETLPTGIDEIDTGLLSIGGFPRGRVSEISAFESQGKTTLVLNFIALFQTQGFKCCFVDAEDTLTRSWAESCGVIWNELDIVRPAPAESVINTLKMAIASNQYDFISVDSISVFNPEDIVKNKDIAKLGMHDNLRSASLMKHFLNGLQSGFTAIDASGNEIKSDTVVYTLSKSGEKANYNIHQLGNTKTHLMMIAHLAEKAGMSFGDPYYTSGGKKKDFAYTFRLRLSGRKKEGVVKGIKTLKGKTITMTLWKSKISVPFKKSEIFMDASGLIDPKTCTSTVASKKEVDEATVIELNNIKDRDK